jgi:hypothetical protein
VRPFNIASILPKHYVQAVQMVLARFPAASFSAVSGWPGEGRGVRKMFGKSGGKWIDRATTL